MRCLLLESFYGGSHKVWADKLMKIFDGRMTMLSLPDRFWKWRMEGSAWEFAKQYRALNREFDCIVFSDLINVSLFLSFAKIDRSKTKLILYMHENQLSYPQSFEMHEKDIERDRHYGFIDIMNAMIVDQVIFNSKFHQYDFSKEIEPFLDAFPDTPIDFSREGLLKKSRIIPIPLALNEIIDRPKAYRKTKTILWNHRWEYDKNPELFFNTLIDLQEEGCNFNVHIIGQKYKRYPEIFDKAKRVLEDKVLSFGFIKSREEYLNLLHKSDIYPVCSFHDFFGISVVEAIASGIKPLLPNRLVYPEHLSPDIYPNSFYSDDLEFKDKLKRLLTDPILLEVELREEMRKYDMSLTKTAYEESFFGSDKMT